MARFYGEIFLNIQNYGILHYIPREHYFADDNYFPFPPGWKPGLLNDFENVEKQQYWFTSNNGLCIYDRRTRQMWTKNYNPQKLAILNNSRVQNGLIKVYIDKQRRIWLFTVAQRGFREQAQYCLDSTGTRYLNSDTVGLTDKGRGYTELKYFFETSSGEMWIYGYNVLLNYDKINSTWNYNKRVADYNDNNIFYQSVFQLMEDRDGNLWLATNQGLYFTPNVGSNSSIINLKLNREGEVSIDDITEGPNGNIWFARWHKGVAVTTPQLKQIENTVYKHPPPAKWPEILKNSVLQSTSIVMQKKTQRMWIGCNNGILMLHDPARQTTAYLHPPEFKNSTVRHLAEDKEGNLWAATFAGRLVKCYNGKFVVVKDFGTNIYKLFFDKDGWLWLATRERGLFALDPNTGKVLQHYTAHRGENSLFSNTSTDIEQMHNNLIAVGAGALHLINKKTGRVQQIRYEDGLPSNTISRLRLDAKGILWIITSNGLCMFNPKNSRFTPYTLRDGVALAEQTIATDYVTSNNQILFGGNNSVIMFNPDNIIRVTRPANVELTDVRVLNKSLPVDSLMALPEITLEPGENNISIFFSSLGYREREKLVYYYKLLGIDKHFIKTDRVYQANYASLPPGHFVFQVYGENIEGLRSSKITKLPFFIRPPIYRTYWFVSSMVFLVLLVIYMVHHIRVEKLLAMESLRNNVARDLHDDMGSTLSTINILSSMAKSKLNVDNLKTSEYLTKISEYSERMMDSMDDIVWSIKPSNDSMQMLIARMRQFATNALEAKNIDLFFEMDPKVLDLKLDMAGRRHFFLIFKEAINNAAKYSLAASVHVRMLTVKGKLILTVVDNGCGFEIQQADGNGLGNMEKRADNLNGQVFISSIKGEGTKVQLFIPI